MVTSYVLYLVQELKDQVELLVCVDNIKQLADHCLGNFINSMQRNIFVIPGYMSIVQRPHYLLQSIYVVKIT